MSGEQALLSLELPSRPEAAGAARKALSSLNGSLHLVSHERLLDAQLLVSEVVANAVRHGSQRGGPVQINVSGDGASLLIEVADNGSGFDAGRALHGHAAAKDHWGLMLVAELAHRWGVRREDDGTVARFEIDRPRLPEPPPATPVDPH